MHLPPTPGNQLALNGPVGLFRASIKTGICGLCGTYGSMTKTHIPAQCALNTGEYVTRSYPMLRASGISQGRVSVGGIWVRGLCGACNSRAGGQFDFAYGELARKLLPCWIKDWDEPLALERPIPQFFVLRPANVARSILMAMFGLNPNLRRTLPEFAADLLADAPFMLPPGRELRLALCRGKRTRVCGAIGGVDLIGPPWQGDRLSLMSDASVYFPPLAWELVDERARSRQAGFSSLLDAYKWVDVSHWTTYGIGEMMPLHSFFDRLPAVAHPKDTPNLSENWIELLSAKISEILLGDFDLPPAR